MTQIQVRQVWELHKYAEKTHELEEKTYKLGQRAPTQEFDSAVDHLIRYWDDLCNLLEEHGRLTTEHK